MGKNKGGYILIDFKNNYLKVDEGEYRYIEGIHQQCLDAIKYRKPVILTNIELVSDDSDLVSKNDIMCILQCSEYSKDIYVDFLFEGLACQLNITPDDAVKLESITL